MNHISITENDIRKASIACITGGPGRIEEIAFKHPKQVQLLEKKREFALAIADIQSTPIVFASHGIGGSSLEILVEELSQIGVQEFVRVGTSGAIQPHIHQGEVVISKASIRLDGVSSFYAPIEYPAVSNYEWVRLLEQAARKETIPFHTGITASTASFYPGQDRRDTKRQYLLPKWNDSMHQWKQLNVLNYEMESASLFVIASTAGLKAACVTGIVAERTEKEALLHSTQEPFQLAWKTAIAAIHLRIQHKSIRP